MQLVMSLCCMNVKRSSLREQGASAVQRGSLLDSSRLGRALMGLVPLPLHPPILPSSHGKNRCASATHQRIMQLPHNANMNTNPQTVLKTRRWGYVIVYLGLWGP
jgi:hypothetical protein